MANTWQSGGRRPEVLHVVGRVLVGPTEVRDELWVVGDRITFAAPTGPADVRTIRGWVLPGLVDAHCHVGLGKQGAVDQETTLAQAVADRDVGALLLRDAGSPADTRWIDDRDDLPRLVRAGRHIARSRRYIRNYAEEVEPDGLAAEVVRQAGRGDGWVKLVGDWIDRSLGDLAPCWPSEAVAEAIAAAHAAGARVTAHCFAEDSLPDLAAAGIDCVEHATGLSDDTIAVFAARGIAIVPTLVNIATFPEIAAPAEDRFPLYYKHMLALHARRYATIGAAYDAGIPIYVGTDAGGSLPHGLVGAEVAELVKAGLPPLAALAAATWSARAWLGFPGLDEGAPADLVVYPEDPRAAPAVLAAPDLIVLRGQPLTGKGLDHPGV
ncbi:amidohydrolase family protein [Frankia sp. AgB1.9]|uniref:amidohydrolase family protein n=1 Tax=unclassified Frankia TaxID=2632575 RepID=UPI00193359D1|nr:MULTISPECIES: amidohydrolase family protein [unclassified Frankia]MBL7493612.1 amidohydrolase family protein [Frankia sp. AgW1.1]MBL7550237.1 amidohydrolase family protein [Frankia sp. AgB1.9]MBL7622410.1 amidohydrolase family protein [Frankia sp. AgB1.8]